jgi:hypothetical protein
MNPYIHIFSIVFLHSHLNSTPVTIHFNWAAQCLVLPHTNIWTNHILAHKIASNPSTIDPPKKNKQQKPPPWFGCHNYEPMCLFFLDDPLVYNKCMEERNEATINSGYAM